MQTLLGRVRRAFGGRVSLAGQLVRICAPGDENAIWDLLLRCLRRGVFRDSMLALGFLACVLTAVLYWLAGLNPADVPVLAFIPYVILFLIATRPATTFSRRLSKERWAADLLAAPIGNQDYIRAFTGVFAAGAGFATLLQASFLVSLYIVGGFVRPNPREPGFSGWLVPLLSNCGQHVLATALLWLLYWLLILVDPRAVVALLVAIFLWVLSQQAGFVPFAPMLGVLALAATGFLLFVFADLGYPELVRRRFFD